MVAGGRIDFRVDTEDTDGQIVDSTERMHSDANLTVGRIPARQHHLFVVYDRPPGQHCVAEVSALHHRGRIVDIVVAEFTGQRIDTDFIHLLQQDKIGLVEIFVGAEFRHSHVDIPAVGDVVCDNADAVSARSRRTRELPPKTWTGRIFEIADRLEQRHGRDHTKMQVHPQQQLHSAGDRGGVHV